MAWVQRHQPCPARGWARWVVRLAAVACTGAISGRADAGTVINDHSSLGTAIITHTGDVFTIGPAATGTNVRGSNLFYSLSTLTLDAGETANFTGPSGANITNVFTRVTGGQANINGTLSCGIPGATFLLIDASGVVFGPDASLNVQGSFAVTTADNIQLSDGHAFAALPNPSDATLTTASPAAFGFLSASPSPISISGGTLKVLNHNALSAVGGDVILSGGTLRAGDGRVNVISVASPGTATVNPTSVDSPVRLEGFPVRGNVSLTGMSDIDTNAGAGGAIFIRAGQLQESNSKISARTLASGNGGGIDLRVTGPITVTDGLINVSTSTPGGGGSLFLKAPSLTLDGAGSTGRVGLLSRSLDPQGGGPAGAITVTTVDDLTVTNGARISGTTQGTGNGGTVNINAGNVMVSDGGFIASNSSGPGMAGNVNVNTGALTVTADGYISTLTNGIGNGGALRIVASGPVTLDGTADLADFTGLSADSEQATPDAGPGGSIMLMASSLVMRDANISASTFGTGPGGSVSVNVAGRAVVNGLDDSNAQIEAESDFAQTAGGGNGGSVLVTADSLDLKGGGEIDADTYGSGAGGSVMVQVNNALTVNGGLEGDELTGISADSLSSFPPGVASPAGAGGIVLVSAAQADLLNGGFISSETVGSGAGGAVRFNGGDLDLINGGAIETTAFGTGRGGDIHIHAASLEETDKSAISASSVGSGDAGAVHIFPAEELTLSQGSVITARSQGSDAGNIVISGVGPLTLEQSSIVASAPAPGRNGGDLTLRAGGAMYFLDSTVRTNAGYEGGDILIDPAILALNTSNLLASGLITGNMNVESGAFLVSEDSVVHATGFLTSPPPDVNIESSLISLVSQFTPPNAALAPDCAALSTGTTSSFVVVGQGGVAPEPGGWLSSPIDFAEQDAKR